MADFAVVSSFEPCASGLLQRAMERYSRSNWRKSGERKKWNRLGFRRGCGSWYRSIEKWLDEPRLRCLISIRDLRIPYQASYSSVCSSIDLHPGMLLEISKHVSLGFQPRLVQLRVPWIHPSTPFYITLFYSSICFETRLWNVLSRIKKHSLFSLVYRCPNPDDGASAFT